MLFLHHDLLSLYVYVFTLVVKVIHIHWNSQTTWKLERKTLFLGRVNIVSLIYYGYCHRSIHEVHSFRKDILVIYSMIPLLKDMSPDYILLLYLNLHECKVTHIRKRLYNWIFKTPNCLILFLEKFCRKYTIYTWLSCLVCTSFTMQISQKFVIVELFVLRWKGLFICSCAPRFNRALLIHNSHTLQFTHLKCTVQRLLI